MMKLFRSDDKFSQMLTQYESTPEFGSGSGGCGDDEIADDEDDGEDEEDDGEDEEDEEDGDIVMYLDRVYIGLYRHIPGDMSPGKSLGKVTRERIPDELSPSNYPGRHVAWDEYPQRHVAREGVEMSLGIVVNVVVG
ncbi:hypothetical protein Tco_1348298 [Tanacetum coccineum]